MRTALCLAGAALLLGTLAVAAAEVAPAPQPAGAQPPAKAKRPARKPAAKAPAPAPPAAAAPAPAAVPASDAQFFGELGYKDCASAADVARSLAIFASEGKEPGTDFEAARAYLKGRGVLPDGWLERAAPGDPVSKSNLARLICRTLGIRGGLWMRLLGPLPRLALRECVYHELMAGGADYAHVSGGELVGVIDRCDRWREKEAGRQVPRLDPRPAASEDKK